MQFCLYNVTAWQLMHVCFLPEDVCPKNRLQHPHFLPASIHAVRNFTLFAPSDTAIQNAFRSGALNYPYLYAKNFTTLEGIVAFHAVPQYQFAAPSKQTLNMKTLLTEVGVSVCLQFENDKNCKD